MKVIERERTEYLGDESNIEDFMKVVMEFSYKTNKLAGFCVIQICSTDEETLEIIKFDTAHGNLHVHRFYSDLAHTGENVENYSNLKEALIEIRKLIKKNWKKYKKWYFEKWAK